jgi:hypothetical protein
MKYRKCAHDGGIRTLFVAQNFSSDSMITSKERKGGSYEEVKGTISERRSSNVSKNHIGDLMCAGSLYNGSCPIAA